MKLRLVLSGFVYAAALVVAALVVTGHLSLTPFTGNSQQVMALENDEGGSALLLCGRCYKTRRGLVVTVPVPFHNNGYNHCSWNCYQPVQHYNTCDWGCYQPYTYNNYWNN